MINDSIHTLIVHARGKPHQNALHDERAVFWVDWREDSAEIPNLCEAVLHTGSLSGEWAGETPVIAWRGTRSDIPLTGTHADPHLAILALNKTLAPDFEIRFVRQSVGNDTAAFVPLSAAEWAALEQQHGARKVADAFAVVTEHPNLYTERAPAPPAWWRFW